MLAKVEGSGFRHTIAHMLHSCLWRHALHKTGLPSRLCWQRLCCHDAPWLFVGLGNPGKKFEGTRHNIGFEMIDAVSHAEGIKLATFRHESLLGEGMIAGARVLLAKPQTYANLSGEAVDLLAQHYGVPVQQIVAIFDDMQLNVAKLWLRPKGGHGDHKGVMSLIKHLRGVGSPPGTMDPKAYVLQKFCKEEREMMDTTIACGVEVVRLVVTTGVGIASDNISRLRKSFREGKRITSF